MGLFDFFKKGSSDATIKSKYEKIPLLDVEADKRTAKGYVERKFIDEEKIYIKCENIFKDSNIPIVCKCDFATKFVDTMVLQNKNGSKVRSVSEIVFYEIPVQLRTDYLKLISEINNEIIKHELDSSFVIDLSHITFNTPSDGITKIPISNIQYNQEKNEFYFIFSNEVAEKANYKYGATIYKRTEHGAFVFDENGKLKKADFTKEINGKDAKIRLKNYKSGFELYDIKYNNVVVYKR